MVCGVLVTVTGGRANVTIGTKLPRARGATSERSEGSEGVPSILPTIQATRYTDMDMGTGTGAAGQDEGGKQGAGSKEQRAESKHTQCTCTRVGTTPRGAVSMDGTRGGWRWGRWMGRWRRIGIGIGTRDEGYECGQDRG